MGSDTISKQELHSSVLFDADLIVSDSFSQSRERGEIHHALNDDLPFNRVIELGEIILGKKEGRTNDAQITVADLTGVAVQDIQIAKVVLDNLE